ncbi:uncharacterized protein LOC143596427 [Bidens hawaiensis]|uniref:uncharacterized protein LOC143596427 n=1 Tax=Bidens hawaiensis TaxID=980011 RepID=UPI00404AB44C
MYEKCFEQLDEEDNVRRKPIHAHVSGFGGEVMHPRGVISFTVTLSDGVHTQAEDIEFLVLPAKSKHDVILRHEAIGDFNAPPSTAHGAVGVPTRTGVAIIYINRHFFATESLKPTYMTGVPQRIAEHKLRVNPVFTPTVQKKRKMGPEKTKAMNEEVQELLNAGIIREIQYQTWVASPVIVRNGNETWRMCIDFKDLNKACPKHCYPFPEINLKVDAVAPFKFK